MGKTITALHPVNAVVILFVALNLARYEARFTVPQRGINPSRRSA